MKTLFLLRHAKSSWDYPDLRDFERPLAARGELDVPTMGRRFLDHGCKLDRIVYSPAARACSTAKLMAAAIDFPLERTVGNPDLYFCGTSMYLKAARLIDDACGAAMLVGHNPTITDFANEMANADIDNIPTCGLVELALSIDRWSQARRGNATLVRFDYPKNQN